MRQFDQIGAEAIGSYDPLVDAETIDTEALTALLRAEYRRAGIQDGPRIRLKDRNRGFVPRRFGLFPVAL